MYSQQLRQSYRLLGQHVRGPLGQRMFSASTGDRDQERHTAITDQTKNCRPTATPGHPHDVSFLTTVKRGFYPWLSMVELVPPSEVRDRISAFSSHSGLLYALLASTSTVAVMWDPTNSPATAADLAEAIAGVHGGSLPAQPHASSAGLTGAMTALFGFDAAKLAMQAVAPLFCISTFFSLQGLLMSMLALGRVQVVPDEQVRRFVIENSTALHSTGWCLIPSVATYATGILCAVSVLHGEPTTTIAAVGLLGLGGYSTYQTFALGYSTERLSQQALAVRASKH